jgi:hypothetical protein
MIALVNAVRVSESTCLREFNEQMVDCGLLGMVLLLVASQLTLQLYLLLRT